MNEISRYHQFDRASWHLFRKEYSLHLTEAELRSLHGQIESISYDEIESIYLPLSRLLNLYISAVQNRDSVIDKFLQNRQELQVPYIIGVAGSVAVGKSLTSRILKLLLSRWPSHPKVEIITTDGFLYSMKELEARGLLERKGFPESYDIRHLISILDALKSGVSEVKVPIYSHHEYDILPHQHEVIASADIIIIEGLNILQTGMLHSRTTPSVFVSDYIDFSIFVEAELELIKQWYVQRVIRFCQTAFQKPDAYFHYLTKMSENEITEFATRVWHEINEKNYLENILPFRGRADLILNKGEAHAVEQIFLKK